MNILAAIKQGPGPQSKKEYILLYLKGMAMGAADIIPGVSGGTIAFITGIYHQLINAIKSINIEVLNDLFHFRISEAVSKTSVKFLLTLVLGIATSVIALSHFIKYLLDKHPENLWSFFFGLILASSLYIYKRIKRPNLSTSIVLLLGIAISYLLVGIIPLSTPETWWFIILAGALAISAMILPGMSGAYILLLLGKYSYMLSALKNPFDLANMIVILLFLSGCVLGITTFSRLVSFFYERYYNLTVAFLLGFVLGSLRKIWPWKETLEEKAVAHSNYVLVEKNILPDADVVLVVQLFLVLVGFTTVYFIEKISTSPDQS